MGVKQSNGGSAERNGEDLWVESLHLRHISDGSRHVRNWSSDHGNRAIFQDDDPYS